MRWQWPVVAMGVAMTTALSGGCGGSKSTEKSTPKGSVVARVTEVEMKEPRFTSAMVNVVVVVENESNAPVQIKSAALKVHYVGSAAGSAGDVEAGGAAASSESSEGGAPAVVFEGAMQPSGKATVEAGGRAHFPVEIELIYPADASAFLAFVKNPITKLKVDGAVLTNSGELQVNDETDFPTPRLLEGVVSDAQMASIDDGAAGEVVLELVLKNPNPFSVKADKWAFKVKVADKELKDNEVGQGENIQPNAGVGYTETFKIDAQSWGPDYKQVLKKSSVPYEVVGTITVGGITYPAKSSGSMKFHR